MEQSDLLRKLASELERLGIKYLVTGSIATISYGEPRFTNDIDVVVELQPAGVPRIEVTFLIDANGILNVTARDQRTGREHSVDIKPSYGLTDEEIERMLEESIDLGEQDLEQRMLIGARNDAAQMLGALAKQLGEYGSLIQADERGRIEECVSRLEAARNGTDRAYISALVEELNQLTTPFAERIMDYAISRALEKKSVEELS